MCRQFDSSQHHESPLIISGLYFLFTLLFTLFMVIRLYSDIPSLVIKGPKWLFPDTYGSNAKSPDSVKDQGFFVFQATILSGSCFVLSLSATKPLFHNFGQVSYEDAMCYVNVGLR